MSSASAISPFAYIETDKETSPELLVNKFYLLNASDFDLTAKGEFSLVCCGYEVNKHFTATKGEGYALLALLASLRYVSSVRGSSVIRKYSGGDITRQPTLHLPFKYEGRAISVIFNETSENFNLVTDAEMFVPMVEIYSLNEELPIEILYRAILLTRKMICVTHL